MTETYIPIATTTLASTATSVSFTSIPGTYRDLRVVFVGKLNSGASSLYMNLNSNGSNIFSYNSLYYNTAITGDRSSNNSQALINYNSGSQPSFIAIDIFGYADTNIYKTLLSSSNEHFGTSGSIRYSVNLFRNSNAITSLSIGTLFGDLLAVGTTATLYGIGE